MRWFLCPFDAFACCRLCFVAASHLISFLLIVTVAVDDSRKLTHFMIDWFLFSVVINYALHFARFAGVCRAPFSISPARCCCRLPLDIYVIIILMKFQRDIWFALTHTHTHTHRNGQVKYNIFNNSFIHCTPHSFVFICPTTTATNKTYPGVRQT